MERGIISLIPACHVPFLSNRPDIRSERPTLTYVVFGQNAKRIVVNGKSGKDDPLGVVA